jgi:hypothetical protein
MESFKVDFNEIKVGGWIYLTQYMDTWMTLLNTVMNILAHKPLGISSATAQVNSCKEWLRSMEIFS